MCTSIREPTSAAIAGSASMLETAPSSWRPPWLLTTSASVPESTASRASSTSWMPLRISLPPQRFLIHSTSSQFSRGSNCCAVHADRPFFRSLCRRPRICRSSVSTSASQSAALARSISRSMKSRSRITYSWNQNGCRVAAATSSIEQMLIVDSVKRMPSRCAARAARISPSACCMPVSPVGAIATGILTSMPTILVAVLRLSMFTATRWRSLIRPKSDSLAR